MILSVYDIEVLPNAFLVCIYDTKNKEKIKFEITERLNQYSEMVDYFTTPGIQFVGYNSYSYDSTIMNHLILGKGHYKLAGYEQITADCFRVSDDIINRDSFSCRHLRWKPFFKQIDLLTMLFSKALRVSLKEMEITMCYHNVQEMKHHWADPIPRDKIDELIAYCFNDVGATTKLLSLCLDDLKLRLSIEQEFKIPCISKDGVGIGVEIFTKFICEEMGIDKRQLMAMVDTPPIIRVGELIKDVVKFKTPQFQGVLEWFKGIVVGTEEAEAELDAVQVAANPDKGKYKKKALLNNLVHTFALGGIHSENRPGIHVSDDTYTIIDLDVASYYPSLIIEWEIAPRGIRQPFMTVIKNIKELRLIAKKNKVKSKDLTFKLAMNAMSGNFKNKFSPFYSPDSSISMCVNGQLMIAMLIEECELNGIECLASNTDGATFKVHKDKIAKLNEIREWWEGITRMVLEETVYEKMVIMAVNDYIAAKKGYSDIKDKLYFHDPKESIKLNEIPVLLKAKGDEISELRENYIKEKGMFITSPRLGKGLDSLIVSKALQNYFLRGIPVEQTVKESKHIWDFVKFERVGKQFEVVWNREEQQRTNRFYVKRGAPYLLKVKEDNVFDKKLGKEITVKKEQNMLKGFGVQLMNQHIDKPIQEYEIDYRYYISQTNKIIEQIEPKQLLLL